MKFFKRTIKVLAKNYGLDPDVLLLALWDFSDKENVFSYLKRETDVIKTKDMPVVRGILRALKTSSLVKEKKENEVAKRIDKKSYNFDQKGRVYNNMKYLSRDEVVSIYGELVRDYNKSNDPMTPAGIKDENLLNSALDHNQTSFAGKVKYPTVETAAAALMYSMTHNHPFHNGNKRAAMVSTLVFLDRHGITLVCDEDELFRISVSLADHKLHDQRYIRNSDAEIFNLAHWIQENTKRVGKGERLVRLKRLKQNLQSFGCNISSDNTITRTVSFSTFGFTRTKTYTSARLPASLADGKEVDRGIVKGIREDLHLTENDNIDSNSFYDGDGNYSTSEFIIKYRKTLQRLAKT